MQKHSFFPIIVGEYGFRHRAVIKLIILAAAIILCGTLDTTAQRTRAGAKTKTIAKNARVEKSDKTEAAVAVDSSRVDSVTPVSVVNEAETDFLSGEASVVVNPKQPTIVRLGLAQNAVAIVEFPASDGVYYIHEGNPKLVSVFQSPTRETDRSITIYPGEGFLPSQPSASATVTLQMRSGLILILEFVPVSEISKNAHRCVINYDRDEVIAARRTAGLAYNLGEETERTASKNTRANSRLVGSADEETTADKKDDAGSPPLRLASMEVMRGGLSRKPNDKRSTLPKTGMELSRLVNKRLADCLKDPVKSLGKWTDAQNGLSLAASPVTEVDAEQRIVVVAVRNDSTSSLRLAPGAPELRILTVDEKGTALQTERLERVYVETTSSEGLIPSGSILFYALVYKAPVMGAGQRLSVLVAHREAADSPAAILLPNVNETTKE